MWSSSISRWSFIDFGVLAEHMARVAGEAELHGRAHGKSCSLCASHVHGGDHRNNVLTQSSDVQVDSGTHHFGNVDLGIDAVFGQLDMLGTDAQNNLLLSNIVAAQVLLLVFGQFDTDAADLNSILAVLLKYIQPLLIFH